MFNNNNGSSSGGRGGGGGNNNNTQNYKPINGGYRDDDSDSSDDDLGNAANDDFVSREIRQQKLMMKQQDVGLELLSESASVARQIQHVGAGVLGKFTSTAWPVAPTSATC